MNSLDNGTRRFRIHTLGCKVNQYESQAIRESLLGAGYEECDHKEIADVYILNTCTVTEHADKESRYMVGAFRRANPQARIIVTGCYVEKDAGEIASLPGVTHIVKNAVKDKIAQLVSGTGERCRIPQPLAKSFGRGMITGFKDHTKAFVKI